MAALIVRFVLGAVFLIAGTAKLVSLPDSKGPLKEFGLPRLLLSLAAWLLAIVETLTGLLLFPSSTARWGAAAAIALSALFAGIVVIALARGRRPDCQCFGSLYSRPVNRWTLGRVGMMALGAAYVGSAAATVSPVSIDFASLRIPQSVLIVLSVLLAAALVTIAVAHFRLLQRYGTTLLALETTPAGAGQALAITRQAPSFELLSAAGGMKTQTPALL